MCVIMKKATLPTEETLYSTYKKGLKKPETLQARIHTENMDHMTVNVRINVDVYYCPLHRV